MDRDLFGIAPLPLREGRPGRPSSRIATLAILAGRAALLGGLVAAPWLYGAVQARVQVWLFAALAIAVGGWLVGRWRSGRVQGLLSWSLVPWVLAIALGWLQWVPLSRDGMAILSPKTGELRESLGSEKNPSDAAMAARLGLPSVPDRQPLSLAPACTRKEVALLVLYAASFALGAAFFSRGRSLGAFLILLAVNGAAIAFFGIVQFLTSEDGTIFWSVPLTYGGSPFGPFVNRNNAGGFLLICLAVALALTVWAFRRDEAASESAGFPEESLSGMGWWSRQAERLRGFLARLDGWQLFSLTLAVCMIAGILCSLSRGAIAAMLGVVLATTVATLLARRRDWFFARMGVFATVAGVALVVWAGMSPSVQSQLATLLDLNEASKPLLRHWDVALRAAPDFWQTGSGLGTYRFVYEQYEQQPCNAWFVYAENMWIETLVEAGAAGLLLAFGFVGLIGLASWRLLRSAADAETWALGIAGVAAVSGQAVASFFDFGLRVPANALTLSVLCGAIVGKAALLKKTSRAEGRDRPGADGPGHPATSGRGWRWLAIPAGLIVLAGLAWGALETRRAAAVELAMKQYDRLGAEQRRSPAEIQRVRQELEEAIEQRSDDAQALCCLAHLDIQLYRLDVYEKACRQVSDPAARNALWKGTSPLVLHGRVQQYALGGDRRSRERVVANPAVANRLLPAVEQLIESRRSCPLLPQVHLLVAELGVLISDPAQNGIHLERAARSAPASPGVALETGVADFQAGRTQAAIRHWRDCLALNPGRFPEIVRRLQIAGAGPELFLGVLPESPELWILAAQTPAITGLTANFRAALLDRAVALTARSGLPEGDRQFLLGTVSALRGNQAAAIDFLLRAVEAAPQNLAWRHELAVLLKGANRLAEAHQQARYCAAMEPANRQYQKLLEEINRTRVAMGVDTP